MFYNLEWSKAWYTRKHNLHNKFHANLKIEDVTVNLQVLILKLPINLSLWKVVLILACHSAELKTLLQAMTKIAYNILCYYSETSVFSPEDGVGQTQAWTPAYVSILRIPQMIWVWRATVEWYIDRRKPEKLGEKPVPVPLRPPQIPHGLTRARTWASAVRVRRLTTWAMARPRDKWVS
jgi:hypothetical protein